MRAWISEARGCDEMNDNCSDPAANPLRKIHPGAAGDGQLHGRICQEIGPEHATPVCKG